MLFGVQVSVAPMWGTARFSQASSLHVTTLMRKNKLELRPLPQPYLWQPWCCVTLVKSFNLFAIFKTGPVVTPLAGLLFRIKMPLLLCHSRGVR